ncbi:MAG: AraC family transcriptional regulator ligand-binding domain-containing protein [Pseudomonadales bacterium]
MTTLDPNWTVYAASVNALLQTAERLGANRAQLLTGAGIDGQVLRQPDTLLPVTDFFQLYQLAEQYTGSADIALYTGRVAYVTGLNVQLYMSTICDTFRDYLNLMPSVLKLRGDIGEVCVRREEEFIRLEWQPLWSATSEQRYLSDEILAASAAIVNSLCIQPIPVQKACFTYDQPADLTLLHTTFGDELRFAQPVSCLYFRRETLYYPVTQLDYEINIEPNHPLRRLFSADELKDPFLASLRQSIVRLLPLGEMTIDTVAGELNVSRRTLQRRLADRNTQFLQVLQDIRAELAKRYLADKRLAIIEIAFLLGYTDQGSFSSAFKTWHGVSPSEFRLG